jgi:hypothetical protein
MNRLKWLIKLANKIRGTTYPSVCVPVAPVRAVLRGGMLRKLCCVTASSKRGLVSLDCCLEINKSCLWRMCMKSVSKQSIFFTFTARFQKFEGFFLLGHTRVRFAKCVRHTLIWGYCYVCTWYVPCVLLIYFCQTALRRPCYRYYTFIICNLFLPSHHSSFVFRFILHFRSRSYFASLTLL